MVRTWHFQCRGPGSIPGRGTKILQAVWCGQKKKKKVSVKIVTMGDFHFCYLYLYNLNSLWGRYITL